MTILSLVLCLLLLSIPLIPGIYFRIHDWQRRTRRKQRVKADPSELIETENVNAVVECWEIIHSVGETSVCSPEHLFRSMNQKFGERVLIWLSSQLLGHTFVWRTDPDYRLKLFPQAIALNDAVRKGIGSEMACSTMIDLKDRKRIDDFLACDDSVRIGDIMEDLRVRPSFAEKWEAVSVAALHGDHVGRVVAVCRPAAVYSELGKISWKGRILVAEDERMLRAKIDKRPPCVLVPFAPKKEGA